MTYGLIVSFSILISLFLAEKLVIRKKYELNTYWNIILWVIIGGIVGARLYHIIDYFETYSAHPLTVFQVYKGGLGIYGALIGGVVGLYTYLKVHKRERSFLEWADLLLVVTPLGQSIGRWANYFNHELYGLPTNLPWGIFIPDSLRVTPYLNNDYYHPLFMYESLLNLVLFSLLWRLFVRQASPGADTGHTPHTGYKNGFFTCLYIVGYGTARFTVDFFRINPWTFHGINVSQMISLIFIIAGLFGIKKALSK